MKSFTPCGLWVLVLGSLACGAADDGPLGSVAGNASGFDDALSSEQSSGTLKAAPLSFPGGGTSAAARALTASLAPETSSQCDPEPSASVATSANVQTVCFFGSDSADVPAATVEQVVEVVGTSEWVHIRLTLNPDFVDNTFGDNAIGWDRADAAGPAAPPEAPAPPEHAPPAPPPPPADGADAPPAPPPPPADGADAPPAPPPPPADGADAPPPPPPPADGADAPPPPPRPGDAPPAPKPGEQPEHGDGPVKGGPVNGGPVKDGPGKGPVKSGHTFDDLVGSDHAELELLDADGAVAMHFKLDYISKSDSAASGYASLGVSGGEGQLIVGQPEWVLASTTSLERNLNACGLSSFTENSPATDAAYTPNPDASDWDYRVAYEVWISSEAFGSAGFGSALIENVHASPSKLRGDTVDVLPSPCPVDPGAPETTQEPLPVVLQNIR